MTKVMTTKMSSKGQVVLPEALRQMYGWESGTAFTVLVYKGSIIMQPLKTPTDEEIAAEFEDAFAQARQQAKGRYDTIGHFQCTIRCSTRETHKEESKSVRAVLDTNVVLSAFFFKKRHLQISLCRNCVKTPNII